MGGKSQNSLLFSLLAGKSTVARGGLAGTRAPSPLPLVGSGRGWGSSDLALSCRAAPPPTPTLPHHKSGLPDLCTMSGELGRARVRLGGGRRAPHGGFCGFAIIILTIALGCGGAMAADDTIVVQGNRRIDAEAIRGHFKAKPAERLEPGAINAALKELYATGLFDNVRIVPSGGRLIVTVVEAPTIEHLRFEGNKKVKDQDLQKEIASAARGPFTKATVQNDVARLVELYHKSGRYAAQVTPKTIARGDGRVDLVFEIKEGDKTGVQRIVFAGNRAFADSRLKTVIKTTESGWFAFLKTSDVYDPDRLEADTDLLRRFYVKNGFADVRVSAAGVFDPTQKGFTVTYSIDEGDRYKIAAVDITSRLETVDGASLRDVVKITPGGVFDGEAVDRAVDDITLALGKRGYPFAAVRPHLSRNAGAKTGAKTVAIAFTIDDGAHEYIERIVFHGNTVTRDGTASCSTSTSRRNRPAT
jgi:outer membrane protein insertion porin family